VRDCVANNVKNDLICVGAVGRSPARIRGHRPRSTRGLDEFGPRLFSGRRVGRGIEITGAVMLDEIARSARC